MKALIDENLSPVLVDRLAELGVAAVHVVHLGKAGLTDPALWMLAFEEDRVVVTINARDFLVLAKKSELHAGLVVLRSQGLSRDEQWEWLEPVFASLRNPGEELVNTVVEVTGPGKFTVRSIPPS